MGAGFMQSRFRRPGVGRLIEPTRHCPTFKGKNEDRSPITSDHTLLRFGGSLEKFYNKNVGSPPKIAFALIVCEFIASLCSPFNLTQWFPYEKTRSFNLSVDLSHGWFDPGECG